jgi:hypothetical protein
LKHRFPDQFVWLVHAPRFRDEPGGMKRLQYRHCIATCEPSTHRRAWRVATTVNASSRRESAGTATCLVEKWRLVGQPPRACGLAADVGVYPPRAAGRAFPAGIPGVTVLNGASPHSLLRLGNGRARRNLHSRGCMASATDLHDALSPALAESSTMRWRKKLLRCVDGSQLPMRRVPRSEGIATTSSAAFQARSPPEEPASSNACAMRGAAAPNPGRDRFPSPGPAVEDGMVMKPARPASPCAGGARADGGRRRWSGVRDCHG